LRVARTGRRRGSDPERRACLRAPRHAESNEVGLRTSRAACAAIIYILSRAKELAGASEDVFPGRSSMKPLSNMDFLMTLRRMKLDATAHAFTVPANRMKGAREHRVPLSARAVETIGAETH
jgi:hypothetical protein